MCCSTVRQSGFFTVFAIWDSSHFSLILYRAAPSPARTPADVSLASISDLRPRLRQSRDAAQLTRSITGAPRDPERQPTSLAPARREWCTQACSPLRAAAPRQWQSGFGTQSRNKPRSNSAGSTQPNLSCAKNGARNCRKGLPHFTGVFVLVPLNGKVWPQDSSHAGFGSHKNGTDTRL